MKGFNLNINDSNNTLKNFQLCLVLRVIGVLLFLYIGLITSWISDDAQITFRQILNFISGDGIVFNFGERVQAFTHPLWFLILSGVIAITDEMFVTTSIVSIIISIAAIILLLKMEINIEKSAITYISPVFFLAFSFAFCDYMTSGLENPLSYLLLSLLLYLLFQANLRQRLQLIFIILALLVLNRLDYAVLFLPLALVLIGFYTCKSELIKVLLPGLALIMGWFIFSTVYFGSPLPNTYYAKLNAGYPQSEIIERGIDYLISLKSDIASILILIISFLSLIIYRNRILISLAIGKVFYLLYVVYIGGDFMIGRFISILILLSIGEIIIVLNKSSISSKIRFNFLLIFLILLTICSFFYSSPIVSLNNYISRVVYKGANDQRGFYYKYTGLLAKNRSRWPKPEKFKDTAPKKYRIVCGLIGTRALTDISKYHIDPCGLTDPLLSRMPAIKYKKWRIGHHHRKIPFEYGQYKVGNISELPDNNLNELLSDVTLVSQADIFSVRRFAAIWRLLTNSYSNVNFEKYTDPSIWVPLTNYSDYLKIENWDKEIPHDNRPYYFKNKEQFSFNNNLIVESRIPKNTSIIWLHLNLGYTYEIYANDKNIFTLNKNRQYCDNGIKIYLKSEQLITKIGIKTTDELETKHLAFNYLKFLRLQNGDDNLEFMPHCVIKL